MSYFFLLLGGDANGDVSGDEQSTTSEHNIDQNEENSMDSDRGGALNLVSKVRFSISIFLQKK